MSRRQLAWLIWGIGVATYAVAIMQRTSLGVLGIQAADHFNTTVGIVSTFVVVQLAAYALGQIPVGLLLDRFGSRAMLVTGSVVMAGSQGLLAVTDSLGLAVAARAILGFGDACIYASVLRLLPFWFAPRRVPVLTQLIGLFGQMGQLAAVGALLPLMNAFGWRPTFLSAAGAGLAMASLALLVVRNAPADAEVAVARTRLREVPVGLKDVVRHPATQLGFWVHLTGGFSGTVFMMMWGMPFLLVGEGRSQAEAAFLFSLTAILSVASAPVIGWLTGRHPLRRSTLVLLTVWAEIVCWLAVLLWPGPAPMWLLVALMASLALAGPGTGVGFDFPRTALPRHRLGSANGVVITGSFSAGTLAILGIGLFLDAVSGGRPYTPSQLTWAMSLQLPIFAVGMVGILSSRRALRRRMAEGGVVVPSWREVVARYRRPRQNRPGGAGGGA